jgi:hypothetical protein
MGMGLFYVTVFAFFFRGGGGTGTAGFAVFLRGVMGKGAFLVWCFAGELVVNCAFIVERRHRGAWRLKTCHDFEIYFQVCCGKRPLLGIVQEGTERFFSIRWVDLRI